MTLKTSFVIELSDAAHASDIAIHIVDCYTGIFLYKAYDAGYG